jgi:predicted dehydrogenase
MSELGLVFLGCGAATLMHSRTLRSLAPQLPRYYASRAGEKAAAFHQRLKGAGWFNSYESALCSDQADVVFIATPPVTHRDLTLAALEHGKHVIVEKPAFLTPEDFAAVEWAAAHAGRQVLVAENYYYKPLARTLRTLIAAGEIGELRLALINALKWQRPAGWRADQTMSGGGPLFEGGIHWVNLLANLGPAIRSVETIECGSPLTALLTARFENDALGVLAYSWETRSLLRGLRLSHIYGTRGYIAFESNGVFAFVRGRRTRFISPGLRDLPGYRAMFRDFLAALATGQTPEFTFAHARRDVQLLRSNLITANT